MSYIEHTYQGYQVFGNITTTEENFKDAREVYEEEGAIFLGK